MENLLEAAFEFAFSFKFWSGVALGSFFGPWFIRTGKEIYGWVKSI